MYSMIILYTGPGYSGYGNWLPDPTRNMHNPLPNPARPHTAQNLDWHWATSDRSNYLPIFRKPLLLEYQAQTSYILVNINTKAASHDTPGLHPVVNAKGRCCTLPWRKEWWRCQKLFSTWPDAKIHQLDHSPSKVLQKFRGLEQRLKAFT